MKSVAKEIQNSYLLDDPELFDRESHRLRIQANILYDVERKNFIEHGISDSCELLDLGCGNGSFLHQLSVTYPKIVLSGVDRHDKLISESKKILAKAKFQVLDLTDSKTLASCIREIGPSVISARYVLQHIGEAAQFEVLKTITQNKNSRTRIFITDTYDSRVSFSPNCSAMDELLRIKGKVQKARGGDRAVGERLQSVFLKLGLSDIRHNHVYFSSSVLGWDTWESIFFPVILDGVADDPSKGQLHLIKAAREWLLNARQKSDYEAKFTVIQVSGV